MRHAESEDRRRFLVIMGSAAVAAVAAACGVKSNEAAVAPSSVAPTTAAPTTRPTSTTAATTTTPATTTTGPTATTTPPRDTIEVICKEAWGAQPVAGGFREHEIDQIMVHHTAVLLEDNRDAPARARQHQAYHQSLSWPDLAYHYLIDARGNVYEGRPVTAIGDTATEYDPTGHLLICCEGNFDEQVVPAEQYATLVRMLAWGTAAYGVDPAAIRGHRDLAATTCPGDALYEAISDGTLATDVADVLRGGAVQLEVVCGSVGDARIAAVEAGTG